MNPKRMLLAGLALCAFAVQAQDKITPPDNSGINVRDRATQTLTPEDQSQSKADLALAARIRRAVLAQDKLTVDGQNIKIITRNNAVTLRGPVKDSAERGRIEKAVRTAGGNATVDNQLEVR